MSIVQNKFIKHVHSPFTFALGGVKAVVEANGKIAIHQGEDVIDTSVAFINKISILLRVERPFQLQIGDTKAEFKLNNVIEIKQFDEENNFDLIQTKDNFILELSQMLRATRTIEWIDKPYREDETV